MSLSAELIFFGKEVLKIKVNLPEGMVVLCPARIQYAGKLRLSMVVKMVGVPMRMVFPVKIFFSHDNESSFNHFAHLDVAKDPF